jgi:hypothetical protein
MMGVTMRFLTGRCVAVVAALAALAFGATLTTPAKAGVRPATAASHGLPRLAWSKPQQVDYRVSFAGSLSCPTTKFCANVDEEGYVHEYNGHGWRRGIFLGFNAADNWAVSCPTATFCAAGDVYGHVSYYNGRQWSSLRQPQLTGSASVIACTSSRFCMAFGWVGSSAMTYNGRSWSTPVVIDPGTNGLEGLSCATSSFCIATDGSGNVLRYNGRSWSKPELLQAGEYLNSVSCPTVRFCAVVGTNGELFTYSGKSWSKPVHIDGTAYLFAVACAGTGFCLAADGNGNFIQIRGRRYVQHIKHFYFAADLSCPATSFCVSMNEGSQAVIGRVPGRRR